MLRKFEITGSPQMFKGRVLHRIKAVRAFGSVAKGQIGGWIARDENLSHSGLCWIADDAICMDAAIVRDNAWLGGNAVVCGYAVVEGDTLISDFARIDYGATITDIAEVRGNTRVAGEARISGEVRLRTGTYTAAKTINKA